MHVYILAEFLREGGSPYEFKHFKVSLSKREGGREAYELVDLALEFPLFFQDDILRLLSFCIIISLIYQ